MSAESRIWVVEKRYRNTVDPWSFDFVVVNPTEENTKLCVEYNNDRYTGLEYRAVAYVRETERKG